MSRFLGHVLLCAIFVMSGIQKLTEPAGVAGYLLGGGLPKVLKKFDIPVKLGKAEAEMLVLAVGGIMVACSLCIVLGQFRRLAAALLAFTLFNVTIFMHVDVENPAKTAQSEMIQVMKNASIIGGLLLVATAGGNKVPAKLKKQ